MRLVYRYTSNVGQTAVESDSSGRQLSGAGVRFTAVHSRTRPVGIACAPRENSTALDVYLIVLGDSRGQNPIDNRVQKKQVLLVIRFYLCA